VLVVAAPAAPFIGVEAQGIGDAEFAGCSPSRPKALRRAWVPVKTTQWWPFRWSLSVRCRIRLRKAPAPLPANWPTSTMVSRECPGELRGDGLLDRLVQVALEEQGFQAGFPRPKAPRCVRRAGGD
jgi:hypothetical protein